MNIDSTGDACAAIPRQPQFSQRHSSENQSHWSLSSSGTDNFRVKVNESTAAAAAETDQVTRNLVDFVFLQIVIPMLCSFGLVGNVLNVIVLSRGRMKAAMSSAIERSSRAGLIGLAVSDMLCCSSSLVVDLFGRERTLFFPYDPRLYVLVYGPYFQNTFIKTSTWLTVLLAVERYLAICRPIHARYMVDARTTRAAIFFTFVLAGLLELPTIWTYAIIHFDCKESTQFYMVDQGPLVTERHLKTIFTYVWAALGFLAPAAVLIYCNVHLIGALRRSYLMGRLYRANVKSSFAVASNRLTLTLISIVCMFLILVTPSELVHLFFYAVTDHDKHKVTSMVIVFTNVLHTVNFAFNFILYCIVNVQFRETWKDVVLCAGRRSRAGGVNSTASAAILTLHDRPNDELYGGASRSP